MAALIDPQTQDQLYELLLNLFGLADEDGVQQRELRAWALLLSVADASIWRAFRQLYPSLADEMLDEWEQELVLPNDRARSNDDRRARVVGVLRTQLGSDEANAEASVQVVASSARAERVTRKAIVAAAVQDEGIFGAKFSLSPEQWGNPAIRAAATFISRRVLPARSVGEHWAPDESRIVFVERFARWGSRSSFFDRDVMSERELGFVRRARSSMLVDGYTQDRESAAASRLFSFGPGSLLRASDINAIQRALLPSACIGRDVDEWPRAIGDGVQAQFFANAVAAGGSASITGVYAPSFSSSASNNAGPDYRDRILYIAGRFSSSNILPGQSADDDYASATPFLAIGYSGHASSLNTIGSDEAATVVFSVASNGQVVLDNDAAGTRYFVGVIMAGPILRTKSISRTTRSVQNQHLVHFAKGESTARLDLDFMRRLVMHGTPSLARVITGYNAGGPGAVRTACFTIHRPAEGAAQVVIDSSISWKDRILHAVVVPISSGPKFPGDVLDYTFQSPLGQELHRTYYTRTGYPTGTTEAGGAMTIRSGSTAVIFCDEDGNLVAERLSTDTEDDVLSVMMMVWASPVLEARTVDGDHGSRVLSAGASDGNPISPRALNELQQAGVMSQGHASARGDLGLPSTPVGTFPLGKIGVGRERRPLVSTRGAIGGEEVQDHQPLNGQLIRAFSALLGGTTSLDGPTRRTWILDDQNDWRDRLVYVAFKTDTTQTLDIRPGAADEADGAAISADVGQVYGAWYSGPGVTLDDERSYVDYPSIWPADPHYAMGLALRDGIGDITWRRWFHVDKFGRLCVTIDALSAADLDREIVGLAFASPQFGPRSSGTIARTSFSEVYEPPDPPSAARSLDPVSPSPSSLVDQAPMHTSLELKWWMNADAGMLLFGDRVIAIADQGPNEIDMRSSSRPIYAPTLYELAYEMAAIGPTRVKAYPSTVQALKLGRDRLNAYDTGIGTGVVDLLDGEEEVTLVVMFRHLAHAGLPSPDNSLLFSYGRPVSGADPAIGIEITSAGAIVARQTMGGGTISEGVSADGQIAVGAENMVIATFRRDVATNQVRVYRQTSHATTAQTDSASLVPLGSGEICLGRTNSIASGEGDGQSAEDLVIDAMIFSGLPTNEDIVKLYAYFKFKIDGASPWVDAFNGGSFELRRYVVDHLDSSTLLDSASADLVTIEDSSPAGATASDMLAGGGGYACIVPVNTRGTHGTVAGGPGNKVYWMRFFESASGPFYRSTSDDNDARGGLLMVLALRETPGSGDIVDAGQETVLAWVGTDVAIEWAIGVVNEEAGGMVTPFVEYNGTRIYCEDREQRPFADGLVHVIELHHDSATGQTYLYLDGVLQASDVATTIAADSSTNAWFGAAPGLRYDLAEFSIVQQYVTDTRWPHYILEHFRRYYGSEAP